MQTWLDRHVKGASDNLRKMLENFPGRLESLSPEIRRRATTDDAFAFRAFIVAAHKTLRQQLSGFRNSAISGAALEIAVWQESLAPFFMEVGREPLAAALDREVVDQLAGTRLSPEVRQYALGALSQHGMVYLDLADRALLLGENLQLCALFIAEAKTRIRFWAVFGEPGRNGNRRVAWIEGGKGLLTDQYHEESVRKFNGYAGTPTVPLRSVDDIARDAGVELPEVIKGLESFAYLATTTS
jgi:hypothetical protein